MKRKFRCGRRNLRNKTYLMVAYMGLFVWPAITNAEAMLSEALVKDIGQAYGYYLGQDYSLGEISKKFSHLSGLTKIAESEFSATFDSSIEGMDSLMTKHAKKDWQKLKKQAFKQIVEFNDVNQITESQARQFIEIVRRRAKGDIEFPVLETLLLFKAGYDKNPEREFLDGYKHKYKTDGSGKAKGIAFSVESPKTWAAEEGNRPNIVQKFTSENGRGFETYLILIKELPQEYGDRITEKEVLALSNPRELKNFLPDSAVLKDSGKLTIENLPGIWMHYTMEMSRLKNSVEFEAIAYSIFFKNKMISMQGQVPISLNGKSFNRGGLQKYQKLFDLMANSLVLTSLYQ